MYDLLNGMRVVELASFIAAPSCALHLPQMGAEVIRIDQLGGGPDFGRWPLSPGGGPSLYREGLNKAKRSVALKAQGVCWGPYQTLRETLSAEVLGLSGGEIARLHDAGIAASAGHAP